MSTNITQEIARDIFDCPRATVSRRWELLRPAIGRVLADCIPDPRQILGGGTASGSGDHRAHLGLDGDPAPSARPAIGMNVQIAATQRSKCSGRKSPPGLRLPRRTGCPVCRC